VRYGSLQVMCRQIIGPGKADFSELCFSTARTRHVSDVNYSERVNSCNNVHRVRKKGATLFLPVTPRNSNRFSQFFLPSRSAVNLQ